MLLKNSFLKFPITIFLIISLKSPVVCQEIPKEKYLVTSGGRINIKTIIDLSGDSLSANTVNGIISLAFDSIYEYHRTRPGRGLSGFLIGAASGITAGVVIGLVSRPEPDYSSLTALAEETVNETAYPVLGGLAGLFIGGGLGYLIGNSLEDETHYDFKSMSRNMKRETLLNLIYK